MPGIKNRANDGTLRHTPGMAATNRPVKNRDADRLKIPLKIG